MLGMMWRSKKALDLIRDPRLVVHSLPSDKTNLAGDVKVYGRAVDEQAPDLREAYGKAIQERLEWRPEEPFHIFSLDVEEASFVVFGEERFVLTWRPSRGLRRSPAPH